MKCFIGIDLGSTTTKAVVMDEGMQQLGRGITNSRSNYDTAAAVSKQEALIDARFTLFRRGLSGVEALADRLDAFLAELERSFRHVQFLEQLEDLESTCGRNAHGLRFAGQERALAQALAEVFRRLRDESVGIFAPGAKRKSDFFRDIAGSRVMALGDAVCKEAGASATSRRRSSRRGRGGRATSSATSPARASSASPSRSAGRAASPST